MIAKWHFLNKKNTVLYKEYITLIVYLAFRRKRPNYIFVFMINLKKWLNRYDEAGFINKEHEKLERVLMWGTAILIFIALLVVIIWAIKESSAPVI